MTVKMGHFLGFRKFVSVLVIIFWEKVNDRGIHTVHLDFIKKNESSRGINQEGNRGIRLYGKMLLGYPLKALSTPKTRTLSICIGVNESECYLSGQVLDENNE